MFVVQYGAEHVPHSLSVRGGTQRHYWEPFVGLVVETAAGWILIDTGMSRAAYESSSIALTYGAGGEAHRTPPWPLAPAPPEGSDWAWIREADPLETALACVGLRPSDISLAAVTHLHVDHSGGIPTLSEHGVPVVIQRRELQFVRSGSVGPADGFFPPDWEHTETAWIELDGDAELAPGVRAISTPGHTPGHMSFMVQLEHSGTWLFAGDAADLGQNFLDGLPCGSTAGGTSDDVDAADASLDRLLAIARETGARIVPGHDPVVLTIAAHPIGGHR